MDLGHIDTGGSDRVGPDIGERYTGSVGVDDLITGVSGNRRGSCRQVPERNE
jgi:hypothetical protein